jgi:medium-chain acyl-[acyl-carrier-protein] hydrolase
VTVPANVPAGRWLMRPVPRPDSAVALYCFGYAGGNKTAFSGWPRLLPEFVETRLVELPGRGTRLREAPIRRMAELLDEFGPVLAADIDRPIAFYGHSLGAIVAMELARWLRDRNGPQPLVLVAGGRRPPQLPPVHPPTNGLTDEEFVRLMLKGDSASAPSLREPRLRDLVLPCLRADIELLEHHQHRDEEPLACDLIAVGGHEDRIVSRTDLEAWREHTTARFSAVQVPGGHLFVRDAREAVTELVADAITSALRSARNRS